MTSKEGDEAKVPEEDVEQLSLEAASIQNGEDILQLEHTDPVLNAKMHLVNDAIDEIGFTTYQWKLFVLNGFGYAVDSLILLIQSIIADRAALEFKPSYPKGMTIAAYSGMLAGALFWGIGADVIGRKLAFNVSLMICSVFAILAGASPNWYVLGLFIALSSFGAGGNLVLDTTVFLEYLPSKDQWLLTLMALWWGIGQLIAGLFAWGFIPKFSCTDPSIDTTAAPCSYSNNKGWRYIWYASGSLVFVMSILRITVIRLNETPKYLLGRGADAEVVETLKGIATRYNRPFSLTLEKLSACGATAAPSGSRFGISGVMVHLRGLLATPRIAISTFLIWVSWALIGLAYPLYNVFLPSYLASRGALFGETSAYITWRNYALSNMCSIFGPILAGYLCSVKFLGRKYTMVLGALATMAFFFAYTQVRNNAQNLGFTCVISFWLNVYYGTLYAYTPEVLPSAHRGTGNGIAVGFNRMMGILSAVIATVADTNTPVPIYICAALYIVMAGIAAVFPFEPYGRRSS
ncbi:MFS general substrate transporter [Mytilinidion resinicola]|uniref:MFS general substrate transporter n=1 Tax=Mytilinidion resinicola TaxID=574789 RepID=A0A6A6Z3S3_9PEZI|nr:MFS general substrate transporter [Mytilinidion resinicola]KAF2815389.1 MFS general substrate transporter [Mytilinidion resinicola]